MMEVMSFVSVAREEVNLPTIVFTHENAAPRICRHVAAMYAYASETRHAYQQRKPATEAGRFRYDHWITALGNGRQTHYLASRKPPN